MTDQDRDIDRDRQSQPHRDALTGKLDTGREAPGADAGTGAGMGASSAGVGNPSGGPDAERDASGLGAEAASGRGGWRGGEPGQAEAGALGRGETGSLGSGGATAPQADPTDATWRDQAGGQTGGAQGQGGVLGGESWEGRARDIGQGGWTQDESGHTAGVDDEERTDLS